MNEIDSDMLDDLVGCIGRLAAEMFSDPQIQKEFAEWKQKKERVPGRDGNGTRSVKSTDLILPN